MYIHRQRVCTATTHEWMEAVEVQLDTVEVVQTRCGAEGRTHHIWTAHRPTHTTCVTRNINNIPWFCSPLCIRVFPCRVALHSASRYPCRATADVCTCWTAETQTATCNS